MGITDIGAIAICFGLISLLQTAYLLWVLRKGVLLGFHRKQDPVSYWTRIALLLVFIVTFFSFMYLALVPFLAPARHH